MEHHVDERHPYRGDHRCHPPRRSGQVIAQSSAGTIDLDLGGTTIVITPPGVGDANGGSFSWSDGGTVSGQQLGIYEPAKTNITTIEIFDSLGSTHDVITHFRKIGDNQWEWWAEDSAGNLLNTGELPEPSLLILKAASSLRREASRSPVWAGRLLVDHPRFQRPDSVR